MMVIDYKRLQRIRGPEEPWFDMNQICYIIICIVVVLLFMRYNHHKQSRNSYIPEM